MKQAFALQEALALCSRKNSACFFYQSSEKSRRTGSPGIWVLLHLTGGDFSYERFQGLKDFLSLLKLELRENLKLEI